MIKFIRINDIALASQIEMELGPGLTLLTGETGAGKSILIDALGLALGDRASADLIRTGAQRGGVEVVAEIPGIGPWLEGHGIPVEGDEVLVRREVHSTGKGRATINGALVPVGLLRELGPRLAAVHGQHDPQGLLDPSSHLGLLDAHGRLEDAARGVAEAWARLAEADESVRTFEKDRREQERRREALLYQLAEIDKAQLKPAEDEHLRREKAVAANAERLAGLCSEAYDLLYEDDAAVLARLRQVFKRVESLAELDPRFATQTAERAGITTALEELAYSLRDFSSDLESAPGRLDEIENRLALIDRLRQKYGATVGEILTYAEACRRQLRDLEAPEEKLQALAEERERRNEVYSGLASDLSRLRRVAARDLEKRVHESLEGLALEKARFEVRFDPPSPDPTRGTARGLELAEFYLSPNPGEELRPLARVASGGELSRLLLALKSAAIRETGQTLVFDEVDAGIGGRVAEVVGRKLRGMASRHQVLCVTHLAPIAAQATAHWRVTKEVVRGRTFTRVSWLSAEERVEELARMMAGERVTDAARQHARDLARTAIQD